MWYNFYGFLLINYVDIWVKSKMKTSNYILPNHISALNQAEVKLYLREKPFSFIQEEKKNKKTSFAAIKGKIKFGLSLAYFVLLLYFSGILFL